MSKPKVLFVCLGNICRSPTAEAVFRTRAQQAGLDIEIESAGTGAWHAGENPDPRTIEAGEMRGYSFAGQSARAVDITDFATFDYILAMDSQNLAHLEDISPAGFSGHLGLFLSFDQNQSMTDVPDPYYGGADGFETVLNLIEAASDGLITELKTRST